MKREESTSRAKPHTLHSPFASFGRREKKERETDRPTDGLTSWYISTFRNFMFSESAMRDTEKQRGEMKKRG